MQAVHLTRDQVASLQNGIPVPTHFGIVIYPPQTQFRPIPRLSEDQTRVAHLLAIGVSRAKASRVTGFGRARIKSMVETIYRKLNVNSQVELMHLLRKEATTCQRA